MPQAEVVLNKPLTGEEVRQIVINKLVDRLRGDTRLADYVAVPAFEFRLDLVLLLEGAVHNRIEHTVEHSVGAVNVDNDDTGAVTAVSHHIEQKQMPPNEARIDAGLDVPVLTHDEKGRPTEKGVKYGKEQVAKQKSR
jgi:hypothetical protein